MEALIKWIAFGAFIALMIAAFPSADAAIDPDLQETRYTTMVVRLANGEIRRRADVIAAFRKIHPCPSTMQTTGACAGWAINHTIPLACGGIDAVSNLTWVHVSIKTGSSATCPYCLDRVERKINALNPPIPDTAKCVNQLVK